MILAAREREALREVLVIAGALGLQDARPPARAQQAADEAHAEVRRRAVDFLGILKLWAWLEASAAVRRASRSSRKHEQLLRDNFSRRAACASGATSTRSCAGRDRARLARQRHARDLRAAAPLAARRPARQHRHEERRGRVVPRRARHPLPAPPGLAPVRRSRAAGSSPPSSSRRRGSTRAASRTSSRAGSRQVGAPPVQAQLAEPHWEKKAAQVVALEHVTLYGLVVYANRRVDFASVDPAAAREIFIREALVEGELETKLPFAAANRKLIAQVEELEHKARRQDVLVDDELIFAFYDQQIRDVHDARDVRALVSRRGQAPDPGLLLLTREELMRHEAAGITTQAFPRTIRLGGIDCAASYLHEPGDPRDGVTVHRAALRAQRRRRGALRVARARHAEGQGRRAGQDLAATAALAPGAAARIRRRVHRRDRIRRGQPARRARGARRQANRPAARREDFKHEQLAPHLLMNLRVVDEDGRQSAIAPPRRAQGGARRPGALPHSRRSRRCACRRSRPPARRHAVRPPAARRRPALPARGGLPRAARDRAPAARRGACRSAASGLHRVDLRRAARADGAHQGRPDRWSATRP